MNKTIFLQNIVYNVSLNITAIDLENQIPSRFITALAASVAFFFIAFGILGDSLITIAIITKPELRNNLVNIFIVSLQINDLINIGFNCLLVGLGYTFMEWQGPFILCEIFVYTSIICTGSLLWHHALISIHRYVVVVCSQNTYVLKMPRMYVTVSLIISRLIPILVCLPALVNRFLFNRNMTVYSRAALRCMLAPRVSGFQNLLIVTINMLIPCVIVLYCFARIFARVRSVSKNVRKHCNTSNDIINQYKTQNSEVNMANIKANSSADFRKGPYKESSNDRSNFLNSMNREIQITKMFAIIFTVFLFGYLPYGVIRLIDAKNNLHPDVYVLLTVIFIISIAISPIIYGLMNTQIRVQCIIILKKLLRCYSKEDFKYENEVTIILPSPSPRLHHKFNNNFEKDLDNENNFKEKTEYKSKLKLEIAKDFKSSNNDNVKKLLLPKAESFDETSNSHKQQNANSIKQSRSLQNPNNCEEQDLTKNFLSVKGSFTNLKKHKYDCSNSIDLKCLNQTNSSNNKLNEIDDGGVYKGP